ncbi:MAG: DUF4250 domain-containing protein [Clostridia bacterium]|nr:DUF4250 domain-containing protein [Clostridia bacterium]
MNTLPQDPLMLLSVINMKLRDFYPSLDALCDDMDADKQAILSALSQAGYRYDAEQNAFVPQE